MCPKFSQVFDIQILESQPVQFGDVFGRDIVFAQLDEIFRVEILEARFRNSAMYLGETP